jgi:hypothetical protein
MTGAAIALVLFLGYVLLVQAMMAAIVLLCEFTILRVQALRALLGAAEVPQTQTQAPVLVEPQRPTYRLGGDLKWH